MSRIKSIIRKKITNQRLYNLAIKDDESYIANGIVVHNCRSVVVPITKIEAEEDGVNLSDWAKENSKVGRTTGFNKKYKEE